MTEKEPRKPPYKWLPQGISVSSKLGMNKYRKQSWVVGSDQTTN